MYTFSWRLTPHPALVVFDKPAGNFPCTRRTRSNTPLQALTLLNDRAFHEFYQAFAQRLLSEGLGSTDELIERAFQLCVARPPEEAEKEIIKRLLALDQNEFQISPKEADQFVPVDAPEELDRAELAAWTSIARVLLNTDEFMTRE
jgi:hypothetical protein